MPAPSTRTVLQILPKTRLLELGRLFAVAVPASGTKEAQAEALAASGAVRFRELLGSLGRDELKAACRSHGLDDTGRARPLLASRLLQAHGAVESAPPNSIFAEKRVKMNPTSDALVERGRARFVAGVPEGGLEDLTAAIAADPQNARAYYLRSGVYSSLSDRDQARATALNPAYAEDEASAAQEEDSE